ncbi:MAG: hypothetical protein NZ553_15240 [Caldilinea sp.]|nr:hypothetical protein [Caldilinea sp.]MDW8441828.1 hypothetical protein [Caldilineaceae bacterium]
MQPQRGDRSSSPAEGQQDLVAGWLDGLWRTFVEPRSLAVVGSLLMLFALFGVLLPQMPGQLRSEALAADRWLTATAEGYGAFGGVLRRLGAFDVLHSPWFLGLLWIAFFLSLMQIAHLVWGAFLFLRVLKTFEDVGGSCGEAVRVVLPERIFRWRGTASTSAPLVVEACKAQMQHWAERVERRTVHAPISALQAEAFASCGVTLPREVQEERALGVRGRLESALRPLLPAGMALALAVVGWRSLTGSSFLPAALLPGERASDAVLGVTVEYRLLFPKPGVVGPALQVSKGETLRLLPLAPGSVELDGVVVDVRPGAPALLVRTLDDAPLLARPGQSFGANEVGLGFLHPGSEQALVMPRYGVGMRIIRQDGGMSDDAFLVEVFQGEDETPMQRFTIAESEVVAIKTTEQPILLAFVPIAMFQVHAYTAPPLWLLFPALLLMLVGAYGFRRSAAFVLVQAGPWPIDRSIVVLQSNRPALLAALRERLDQIGEAGKEQESGRG